MAYCRHFPAFTKKHSVSALSDGSRTTEPEIDSLKNTDDPGFRLVVDEVIDLVVSVDQSGSVLRLGF